MGGVKIGCLISKIHYILDGLERFYYRTKFEHLGCNTYVGHGGIFTYSNISIGDNCHIGQMACLQSAHGKIHIGDNVMLGPYVSIHGGNHIYNRIGVLMNGVYKCADSDGSVVIEDNVWIGANAVILQKVRVKRGAIVAAGAVVSKDVPPYSIVGGIPARHLKFYWTIDQILEHEKKLYPKSDCITRNQLEYYFDIYAR